MRREHIWLERMEEKSRRKEKERRNSGREREKHGDSR
jgi:hypothetical protein